MLWCRQLRGEAMLDANKFDYVSEIYTVEKTIEIEAQVHGVSERIRIHALSRDFDSRVRYSTTAEIEVPVTIHPCYGPDGSEDTAAPREANVWVDYDIPWTDGETADDVLNQAMLNLRRV